MFGQERKNTYYYGSETHKYITEFLKQRGELLIVSPYIDRHYAQILRKLHGRKIRVITSSADADALKLLGKGGSMLWIAAYMLLSTILLYALALLGAAWYYLPLSAIPLFIGTAKHWRISRNISLKVPAQFVHVKMYISDNIALTGSANLTYNGMYKNVEHVTVVYSKDEIGKLRKQFWGMWDGL